jgi:hypothetical protein
MRFKDKFKRAFKSNKTKVGASFVLGGVTATHPNAAPYFEFVFSFFGLL